MVSPKILVVDDQMINIRLLERKLSQNGMQVFTATSGEQALEVTREEIPEVILLDIMMPGMDGIEVCRHLKESENTRDIPVIFITARTSKEGKLEGLEVGAADYLTKPIDLDETLARVRTQVRILESHRENLRLTRELEETRRQTAMMHLTEGIAHNLNNLLGVALGYVGLLRNAADNPERMKKSCDHLETSMRRMSRIVHQLTVIGQFESIRTESFRLRDLIQGGISRFKSQIEDEPEVTVESALPEDLTLVTNNGLFESMLERILMNAFESYSEDSSERPVVIKSSVVDKEGIDYLKIEVCDEGRGIPDSVWENVFDPFVSTSPSVGRGMGLTIARHSVKSLQGELSLKRRENGGIIAEILLPMNLDPDRTNNDE